MREEDFEVLLPFSALAFLMLALVDAVKRAVVEAMERENIFIVDRYAVFLLCDTGNRYSPGEICSNLRGTC